VYAEKQNTTVKINSPLRIVFIIFFEKSKATDEYRIKIKEKIDDMVSNEREGPWSL